MRIFGLPRWSFAFRAWIFLTLACLVPASPAACETVPAPPSVPSPIPQETTDAPGNGYTGKLIPPFDAVTVDGRSVSTSVRDFKALIVELWGLNCASCLEEMVAMEPVYQEFRERGLRVWSVNAEGASAEKITAGLGKKGIKVSYDLIVDLDCSVTHLFTRWFIPVTVIVDRDGMVQYYKIGYNKNDIDKIRGKVEELIAP